MTKKFLAVTLVLVLAAGFAALAQSEEPLSGPYDLDVGVEITNPHITPRVDMAYGYLEVPFTKNFRNLGLGAKTPPLIFDVYGLAGVNFKRKGKELFSGWGLRTNGSFEFGFGKSVEFDKLILRLEPKLLVDRNAETGGKIDFLVQYRFADLGR